MRSRRPIRACVWLALPVVLLAAVSIWLLNGAKSKFGSKQQGEISKIYRVTAEDLLAAEGAGEHLAARPRGWRQTGKIRQSPQTLVPWGYAETNGMIAVWVAEPAGKGLRLQLRPPVAFVDVAGLLCVGVALGLVVSVGLAGFGIFSVLRHDKARDDFLAAAAHDLTTPLVGMRGLIGRDDGDARALCERMLRIVGNIRDFLGLGGRRPPERTVFPIGRAYKEAYAVFALDFEDLLGPGGVTVSGDAGLEVAADETYTVQILWNLLGNDLKYAAPHGPVRVSFAADGAFVRVAFADEGPGMAAKARRRAFDRYYRERTILQTGKGGFGIGLCTAREFARAMGGDLTVRGNAPRGCVFELTLPRAQRPSDCGKDRRDSASGGEA